MTDLDVPSSELYTIWREVREVQPLILRIQLDVPQLHRDRPEQHLNSATVFVAADFLEDTRLEFQRVPTTFARTRQTLLTR